MVDLFDRAQALDADYLRQALEVHAKTTATGGESHTHCIDCDEPIPEARRTIVKGCIRCIDCATAFEQNKGR